MAVYLKETRTHQIQMANDKDGKNRLLKTLELLDLADEISNTVPLNRIGQKGEVEYLLRKYSWLTVQKNIRSQQNLIFENSPTFEDKHLSL